MCVLKKVCFRIEGGKRRGRRRRRRSGGFGTWRHGRGDDEGRGGGNCWLNGSLWLTNCLSACQRAAICGGAEECPPSGLTC